MSSELHIQHHLTLTPPDEFEAEAKEIMAMAVENQFRLLEPYIRRLVDAEIQKHCHINNTENSK